MNTCPHCGEALQEGARFCPYCMTSLDDKTVVSTRIPKQKGRLLAATAVLLFALCVFGSAFLLLGRGNDPSTLADIPITTTESQEIGTTDSTTTAPSAENGVLAPSSSKSSTTLTNGTVASTSKTANATTTSTVTTAGNTESSSSSSTAATTTAGTTIQPVTYTYIAATSDNTYPPNHVPYYGPTNAVVITGVAGVATNGVYEVPDTIDGQKVAAIMPSAFADVSDYVKTVILPSSVRTVWSDAFVGCCDLTALYFRSETIAIYENAFPASTQRTGTLTFYCAHDCRNFDFYYYRNIADDYGARYEEWDGSTR